MRKWPRNATLPSPRWVTEGPVLRAVCTMESSLKKKAFPRPSSVPSPSAPRSKWSPGCAVCRIILWLISPIRLAVSRTSNSGAARETSLPRSGRFLRAEPRLKPARYIAFRAIIAPPATTQTVPNRMGSVIRSISRKNIQVYKRAKSGAVDESGDTTEMSPYFKAAK